MRHAVFMQFWAGAQVLKSVGCQKQKPPWKVSGAVGWLHDTARGVIFEYIPNSVFLFASFSRGILLSSWLIPCQSGQPARTAMKRSVIFLHMEKELRCYNVTAQPFPASARCFLLYPRASTFFDATLSNKGMHEVRRLRSLTLLISETIVYDTSMHDNYDTSHLSLS